MAKVIAFLPELFYLFMALVMFLISLDQKRGRTMSYPAAMILATVGLLLTLCSLTAQESFFYDTYRVDLFSQVFKAMLGLGLFLVVSICRRLEGVEERYWPEFFMFLTTGLLGMMLMVSAMELMTMYLALELSSFSLYILVPLRKGDQIDIEAGVKYLFIGMTASCVMLFGLSYVFGALRSTNLPEIAARLPLLVHQPGAAVGLLLLLSGLFFKLAVVPFHFWAPDVYQGAANQVTTYIATASKVAAVALLIRLTALTGGTSPRLIQGLIVLAVASMTLGNLVALVQTDLKRMLAYSAISHAGYVMIGILTMSEMGYVSAAYYALAYMIMNFAAFMVVIQVASVGEDLRIADLAGLHRRSPLLALTLMLALFSLAGIPPTAGFTGKFLVFAAAVQSGRLWLAILGMLNATVSLYYYLMVIRAAYLLEPSGEMPGIPTGPGIRWLSYGLILALVYLGVYPQPVFSLAESAIRGMAP